MTQGWCAAIAGGVRLAVQIQPNAKKTEVVGVLDDALKIKLQAAPIEGKANEALVRWVAATLSVPRSAVEITHGHTSKRKLISVKAAGMTPERAAALLWEGDCPQRRQGGSTVPGSLAGITSSHAEDRGTVPQGQSPMYLRTRSRRIL